MRQLCTHGDLQSHDIFTDSWSKGEIEIENLLVILLHRRRFICTCTYANTWPVYGCDFTYLGYPQKLKCESARSDQSAKIFTLEVSLAIVYSDQANPSTQFSTCLFRNDINTFHAHIWQLQSVKVKLLFKFHTGVAPGSQTSNYQSMCPYPQELSPPVNTPLKQMIYHSSIIEGVWFLE